jgi:hypothetical protein
LRLARAKKARRAAPERSRVTFRFDASAPEITLLVSASDEDERQ